MSKFVAEYIFSYIFFLKDIKISYEVGIPIVFHRMLVASNVFLSTDRTLGILGFS